MSMLDLVPWRRNSSHLARGMADDLLMPLHQRIDRVFSDFFGTDVPRLTGTSWDAGFSPSMDVSETDQQFEVTAELPGLDEKDLEVTLTDGVLTIRGEKKSESRDEDKERNHYRLERSYGTFRRSLQLPPEADAEQVSASFDKGVLRVTIAKKEEAGQTTRKIELN
ncbi:MAG: Hsp20/alpha crystallin family protein [Rhodospirillales bacterium]|nr:Hsp20/alpha crystallin family protein [Rhodospirillales bacterium]